MEVSIFKVLLITGLHVPICRMFNYDVGRREDSLLFIYIRVALGNGRTDASSVVYVRRTPSELPSARDGQPADLTYIHGLAGMVLPEERERERDIPYTCTSEHVARSNHSFTAKHLFLV